MAEKTRLPNYKNQKLEIYPLLTQKLKLGDEGLVLMEKCTGCYDSWCLKLTLDFRECFCPRMIILS